MKNVYLFPGIFASDLGVFPTGPIIWWDPSVMMVLSLGKMRLAPNGSSPGPPDGVQMAVDTVPQSPWNSIKAALVDQLDIAEWNLAVGPYDWRLDISSNASSLATNIRNHSTPAEPATIVGHSMGGLVGILAYSLLKAAGQDNLVRRIITICSPFLGSYAPIQWLAGVSPSIEQLLNLANAAALNPFIQPGTLTLGYINGVALTWPGFYDVLPALTGDEANHDPNRILLYTAANYPLASRPSQAWLDQVKTTFQPLLQAPTAFPPSWVMTCVYGEGIDTAVALTSNKTPLNLNSLATTSQGDGIVTSESAQRSPGLNIGVVGSHSSIPLAMALDGSLAKLILDPRGPLDPPPPNIPFAGTKAMLVTDPPASDPCDGTTCIGGHC
jgi:pimeloyl-ACP methyl ester carboxylesterase